MHMLNVHDIIIFFQMFALKLTIELRVQHAHGNKHMRANLSHEILQESSYVHSEFYSG